MKKHQTEEVKTTQTVDGRSRRVFLTTAGKLIGLGILTRFSLVGYGKTLISGEHIQSTRTICKVANLNVCNDQYNCTGAAPHSCHTRFTCQNVFTCSSDSVNQCTSTQFKE